MTRKLYIEIGLLDRRTEQPAIIELTVAPQLSSLVRPSHHFTFRLRISIKSPAILTEGIPNLFKLHFI